MRKPKLKLTAGQAAWALWRPMAGRSAEPSPAFLGQLLYLREAGVPFSSEERPAGSGHNVFFNFDHLAELAVAIELVDHGAKPSAAAALLVSRRKKFRDMFEQAYDRRFETSFVDHPDLLLTQGLFLELTLHYGRDEPMVYEPKLLTPPEATKVVLRLGRAKCSTFIIQLSQLLERTITRAIEAPEMPRGRPRR